MQDREIEARKWLAELDEADAKEAASKRDAREEETLAIAREANKYARKANIWAAIAALIAAVAMYFAKS
ncbi:hypothetical protein C1O66_03090 [Paucibacter aquatile]|uniref:Uncharacterized protein n=2 Tax=Kinneretia aquatilis TaxID=2070761 RepID=A0A2N8L3U2_9BURK|nr:hypothetical protein C1O66_03090 [Paucibacter aquatile]